MIGKIKKKGHDKACHCCSGTGAERDNANIGKALRSDRLKAGVKLRALARLMGISHSYLCQLESGRRNWTEQLYGKFKTKLSHD